MKVDSKCKICRRLGTKLFLKGERCFSPKCAMVKRPYSPGQKGKKRGRRSLSDYGKSLKEKQKLKKLYNLKEGQFRNYVKGILKYRGKVEDISSILVKRLENRLDNIVFRLGFADSRTQARQLVSHGHFLVNNRAVNIPSYQIKKGDVIKVHPSSSKKNIFQNLQNKLKKYQPPSWISLDSEKLEGKIVGSPKMEEINLPVEISAIFEFYSK